MGGARRDSDLHFETGIRTCESDNKTKPIVMPDSLDISIAKKANESTCSC